MTEEKIPTIDISKPIDQSGKIAQHTTDKSALPDDIFNSTFLMGNVGAPFIIGLAVGYFAKKMFKTALFIMGGIIVLMMVGESYGIITINEAALMHTVDAASTAAKESGHFLVNRLSVYTARGVSATAGFFLGFKNG